MTRSHSWQFSTYGTPSEVLSWQKQELSPPGPGQAWLQIRAIGINRSDLQYVQGHHFPSGRFPSCLGGEAVGEIIALGPKATAGPQPVSRLKLEIGARVGTLSARINPATTGVYRDIGLYEQASLAPVPDDYSDEEGAAFWTALLTMGGAMEMGGLTAVTAASKRVLITAGASGMGTLALKLLKHWGATTIATTRQQEKANDLGKLADHVIVCADAEGLTEGVKEVTQGHGADLILDPVGSAFYPGLLAASARCADIVSYECMSGVRASISIMDMMMKDVSFHGFTTFRVANKPALLDQLIGIGLDSAPALRPEIYQRFELAEAPEALAALGRSEHVGKMVLTA
ncbi:MAG: quinone oxidoreductase family protein, partial [Lysobacterales bacterium]